MIPLYLGEISQVDRLLRSHFGGSPSEIADAKQWLPNVSVHVEIGPPSADVTAANPHH